MLSTSVLPSVPQSLENWTLEDPDCLCNLLEELLEEYRLHHRRIVAGLQRLSFELNTLLESKDYGSLDVYCSTPTDGVSASVSVIALQLVLISEVATVQV